jgi:hypothetical protein
LGWRGDEDFERLYRRPDFDDSRCGCASEFGDGRGVRGCGCDDEDEGYGSSVRRGYEIRDRDGADRTASRYAHDDNHDFAARRGRMERDPWTHQPAYPMNEYDFPSTERSDRHSERYDPIQRSWGADFQRAFDDAVYSSNRVSEAPMSRWERESRRERPWDGVGGVYPGDLEWSAYGYGYGDPGAGAGAGEYDVSARSPEYWGSDVADAGTGGYGSRRPEYWGSNVVDVGNDRAYPARTSSRTRR